MSINPFFYSVHVASPTMHVAPRVRFHKHAGRYLIAPIPIRGIPFWAPSLKEQREEAARNPRAFEEAIHQIAEINQRFLINPSFRNTLCCSTYNQGKCLNPISCNGAGSLAELYANNISHNPYYKTEPCLYGNSCREGSGCHYGHEGDLMRTVMKVANLFFTTSWYILKSTPRLLSESSQP